MTITREKFSFYSRILLLITVAPGFILLWWDVMYFFISIFIGAFIFMYSESFCILRKQTKWGLSFYFLATLVMSIIGAMKYIFPDDMMILSFLYVIGLLIIGLIISHVWFNFQSSYFEDKK